jgi:hypothetical protein
MAIQREDFADIELTTGRVHRTYLNHPLSEGDADADIFGIRVFRNGEPVALAGSSCVGYFVRADGTTEEIDNGSVSQNKAMLTLPAACYAVEGNFQLSILLTGGDVTATLRIIDGTIVNKINGAINDPTGDFPDPEDYADLVTAAQAAATKIAGYKVEAVLIEDNNYEIDVTTIPEEE